MKTHRQRPKATALRTAPSDRLAKFDRVKAALCKQGYRTRKSPNGGQIYRIYRGRTYLCSMFWDGQTWQLSDAEFDADRTKLLALVQDASFCEAAS